MAIIPKVTTAPKIATKEQYNQYQNTPEYQKAVENLLAQKRGAAPNVGGVQATPMNSNPYTAAVVPESHALGYMGGQEYSGLIDKFLEAKANGQNTSGIQAQAANSLNQAGVNTLTGQDLTPVKDMSAYTEDARQQYEPTYNQRVQLLKSSLANNITNLENNKTGINQNFDQQITKNNRYIKGSQNQFSNNVLGRGLGRSTIATSGLGEMSNIGARMNDETNFKRTQELGNIDSKIATEKMNTENKLTQMDIDKQDQIAALAKQLMKEDKDDQWKQRTHQDEMYMQKLGFGHQEAMQDKQFTHDFDVKSMEQGFAKEMEADKQKFEIALQDKKNDFMREMKNIDMSEAEKERQWKALQATYERNFQASQNEKNRANQIQLSKMQIAAQKSYSRSGGGGGYYRSYGGGSRGYSGYKKSGGSDDASDLMGMYSQALGSLGKSTPSAPKASVKPAQISNYLNKNLIGKFKVF